MSIESQSFFEANNVSALDYFPNTVLFEILKFLTPADLNRTSLVSKDLLNYTSDDFVWRHKLSEIETNSSEIQNFQKEHPQTNLKTL